MSFKTLMFKDADAPVKNYGYGDEQDTVIEETPAEEVVTEVAQEEAKEAAPVEVQTATDVTVEKVETPVYDWKKELKTVDKKEILRELGLDDFTIGMIDYKEKAGDLSPYLEVKSVDYTKMDAEAILRTDMKKANPGMSERALTFKFNKELNDRYFLDRDMYPEDSDEAVFGQEQLRLDSDQKRKELIDFQQSFRAPEAQPDLAQTQREAAAQEAREERGKQILSNEQTAALTKSKSIQFGDGEDSFTLPIADVDDIVDRAMGALMNSDTDLKNVNFKEFYQAIAIGKDLNGFLTAYGGHQRALEHKRLQAEMQNVTPKNDGTVAAPVATVNYGYGERR